MRKLVAKDVGDGSIVRLNGWWGVLNQNTGHSAAVVDFFDLPKRVTVRFHEIVEVPAQQRPPKSESKERPARRIG